VTVHHPPLNPKHAAAFEQFDRDNPLVWRAFKKYAFQMAHSQFGGKLSASLITERIRWEMIVETRSADPFKINNNFRAYYARKFEQHYPVYAGCFETRSTPGTVVDYYDDIV
jgi:hypothetical protein